VNRTPSSVVLHRHDRCSSVTIVSRVRGAQAQSRSFGPIGNGHFPLLYCVKVVCVFHKVFCPATPETFPREWSDRNDAVSNHILLAEDEKDWGYTSVKVQYTCKTVVPQ